jgi:putative glutathione S-transferase
MLVNGKCASEGHTLQAKDEKGGFVCQTSSLRYWVTPDGSAGPAGTGGFAAEAGRYHLYEALTWPLALRMLMARKLKDLEDVISVAIVEPKLSAGGWKFCEHADTVNGVASMHELYTRVDPSVMGRATVLVLWDKQMQTIVTNASADIVRLLNTGFGKLACNELDLYPSTLRKDIDALNGRLYSKLNNGVYRTGIATTQVAYEKAFWGVFKMLDELELRHTKGGSRLFGECLTESNTRLFVTLVRFDAAYFALFNVNLRRIADYPALSAYLERVLNVPGLRETANIDHIRHCYYSIKALNPTGIVPPGPDQPMFEQASPERRAA